MVDYTQPFNSQLAMISAMIPLVSDTLASASYGEETLGMACARLLCPSLSVDRPGGVRDREDVDAAHSAFRHSATVRFCGNRINFRHNLILRQPLL